MSQKRLNGLSILYFLLVPLTENLTLLALFNDLGVFG
jgi:hypothetical protein